MKAYPIGEWSACCKPCAMEACRMNINSTYDRVGVCGATVDTIAARNFGRIVATGTDTACPYRSRQGYLETLETV